MQGGADLDPAQHAGGGATEEEKEKLSSIIHRMNEKFGTDFTEADKYSRDQLYEDMMEDDELAEKARNNTLDNFAFSFKDSFMDFIVERLNEKNFYMKLLGNEEIRTYMMNDMLEDVYQGLRK